MNHSRYAVQCITNVMEGFDAVYPFGGGDTWELTQSIRLLRKYARGLRDVYIIGEATGLDAIHIPYIEENEKEINIWKKTCAACFVPEISDTFLFMNDDHFVVKELDIFLNYYYEGSITDIPAEGQYRSAVDRTVTELTTRGLDTKNFDIHCPMFIEKARFIDVFYVFGVDNELLMKSCYCNYHKIEGAEMQDLKFRWLANRENIEKNVQNRWVFSTHELLFTQDLREFILNS